jgi:hypothetical protein
MMEMVYFLDITLSLIRERWRKANLFYGWAIQRPRIVCVVVRLFERRF